jgi:hypothetical protein
MVLGGQGANADDLNNLLIQQVGQGQDARHRQARRSRTSARPVPTRTPTGRVNPE